MKLLELEIHNFRGIRDLSIEPEGNNFLIYGPNGSGKSAVVDALDFLLTGQISRMKGTGNQRYNIKKTRPTMLIIQPKMHGSKQKLRFMV